jgi:hypothetical protein
MEVLIRTSNHLSTGAQGAHHPGHAAMAIDFTLTSAQQRLQRNAREFAVEILQPLVKTADREPDTQKAFQTLEGAYIECHKLGFAMGFLPNQGLEHWFRQRSRRLRKRQLPSKPAALRRVPDEAHEPGIGSVAV